jgi:2'-5' RNA ligase
VNFPGSVAGSDRLRLFCGFRLPETTLRALSDWQAETLGRARGVRILPAEHLHVTLAFLGSRPAEEREAIVAALRTAAGVSDPPCFTVRRYRETRSVGMLALDDEDGRGAAIAAALQAELERLGVYEPEARDWLAHVTVVRFRHRPRLKPELPPIAPFSPSEAALYHSVLRPTGAQYEVLDTIALGMRR